MLFGRPDDPDGGLGGHGATAALRRAGTFALVTSDPIDRLALATLSAHTFGLDAGLISTCPAPDDQRFPAPVPVDTSINPNATNERLGLRPLTVAALLAAFKRECESGRLEPSRVV